ncbi:MAG: peptidylprolyl isomerase [Fimbriimonadaceae bacterium]|nr:peptidylprolyl isomerase [Fimbriimonadaceae bacterium]
MKALSVGILLASLLAVNGCGGNGKSSEPPTTARIEPATVTLKPGTTQQFTAFLNGNTFPPITWSVDGAPDAGTISASGKYFAPTTAGTYTVRVAVTGNPSISGTALVTITEGVQVQITAPATIPTMSIKSTLDFDATVSEATNPAVTWSASAGTIDSAGIFTAPTTPGTYTITATSVENPSRTASKQVIVVTNPQVTIDVEGKGTFVMQLNTDQAPNTSANLVSLANKGFYDGIIFHRYEPDFVIQGGDPLTKTLPLSDPSIGTGGPGYTIPFESNPLLHKHYALGMARSNDLDSGGSQWYICLKDLPTLDGNYVVFGRVTSGFEVVDALRRGDKMLKVTVGP